MPHTINNWALPLKTHKQWLRHELAYACIDHARILGLIMLLERIINREQQLLLRRQVQMPFYKLHNANGHESQAWVHIAETALWLNYKQYKPFLWFTAICQWPPIKKQLMIEHQTPIYFFAPTSRLNAKYIHKLEQFYLRWVQTKRNT